MTRTKQLTPEEKQYLLELQHIQFISHNHAREVTLLPAQEEATSDFIKACDYFKEYFDMLRDRSWD